MVIDRFIGVDLAWTESGTGRKVNETGVVVLDGGGAVLDAGWTEGVDATATWIDQQSGDGGCFVMVDAPLVVDNPTKQRACEKQVGQRYGRWKVSANSTNTGSPRRAGVALLARLECSGWRYDSGIDGPPTDGRAVSECYPYTTLVGVEELGYERERPMYKRKPPSFRVAEWRPRRAHNCDELISRIARLSDADPPLDLLSHAETRQLIESPSPLEDRAYKHREDLIDAAVAAWTGLLWIRKGHLRSQVLGSIQDGSKVRAPTIIAPARHEQRRAGPSPFRSVSTRDGL